MVDENKVKLMTKISIFEKKENKDGIPMSKFFERDYVRFNVLKTLVAATIVYWTVVGAYVFVSFEVILAQINNMDYFGVMYRILGWYVVFCFCYFVFAYLVYAYRYNSKRKGLAQYNSNLKDLIELSGGPMHHGKLVKNSDINVVKEKSSNNSKSSSNEKMVVNRSRMLDAKLKEEEEIKRQQIIENSRRREERIQARKLAEEDKQRQVEDAKRQIRERRIAIEEEQRKKRQMEYGNNFGKGDNR